MRLERKNDKMKSPRVGVKPSAKKLRRPAGDSSVAGGNSTVVSHRSEDRSAKRKSPKSDDGGSVAASSKTTKTAAKQPEHIQFHFGVPASSSGETSFSNNL